MKRILSITVLLGTTLSITACNNTPYNDWDYFNKEIRPQYRGAVIDGGADRVARDSQEECVKLKQLRTLSNDERLAIIRSDNACNKVYTPMEEEEAPAPVVMAPKAPMEDPAVEESMDKLDELMQDPAPAALAPVTTIRPIKDSKIVFFDFNDATLTPTTKLRLQSLIDALQRAEKVESVKIVGHADRIGASSANVKLSQRRANAVRDYLYMVGNVKSEVVDLDALGESISVTDCNKSLPKAELVACLQADRRVEIVIEGYEK